MLINADHSSPTRTNEKGNKNKKTKIWVSWKTVFKFVNTQYTFRKIIKMTIETRQMNHKSILKELQIFIIQSVRKIVQNFKMMPISFELKCLRVFTE